MKRIFFSLLAISSISVVSAQTPEPEKLLPALKQQYQEYRRKQPEKIYLHTDRDVYAASDTIWYKAYVMDPQTHAPHPVAEILYLDLIAENKQHILTQRLKTENGAVAGSLELPDTLETGNYLLQAYTNFQRNAGPHTFFRQHIYVNKVPVRAEKTVGNLAPKVGPEKRYGLSVKNAADSVTVLLDSKEISGEVVYLVLQSRGNLLQADTVMFNAKGLRKRSFSAKSWYEGILQVSLLNAKGQPENERLIYLPNSNPLQVKLETDKKVFGRREPVQVNLNLTNAAGKPVEAAFSVAVTNNLPVAGPTLRQHALISSEIGVQSFPETANQKEINDLLLTSELNNFSWKEVLNSEKKTPEFARETASEKPGLVTENDALVGNAVIYLLETQTGKTHLLTSDAKGQFRIPAEGSRFFYQIWQQGVLRPNAILQPVKTAEIQLPENQEMIAATDSVLTQKLTLRRQIERVYANKPESRKAKLVNKDMWPAYPANHYYPLEEYNQLNTVEEILREMVPSVRVVTRKKKVQANVYNEDTRTFYPNQPLYIIDGQPTWNNDLFLRLDASQLEQVNIYNSAKTLQPFGFMGNNGVIVIFTKSRNYQNPELNKENILAVTGQKTSSSYKMWQRPAHIPDFRPTLFWNPDLKTNAEGKANFTFQTSDEMGVLKIQIEGVTKNGELISEELLVPVQAAK